jgi:alpha-mannosidase
MPAPLNPLPQLIPARALRLLDRLRPLLWKSKLPLSVEISPLTSGFIDFKKAKRLRFSPLKSGQSVGPAHGAWKQRWLRFKIPAASSSERGQRYLLWDCQGEATVYIDGEPWCGLDQAHQNCPLPDKAALVFIRLSLWQTGLWIPGMRGIDGHGARFEGLKLGIRDALAWETYWDWNVLCEAMQHYFSETGQPSQGGGAGWRKPLDSCPPLLRRFLDSLNRACDAFDLGHLAALRRATRHIYASYPAEPWQPSALLNGHAHIDLIWLWPESATEQKGVHTFATQLSLMKRYPEFRFTQSQPALYRAIKRLEPNLSKRIQGAISAGRWEATGALEVEPDTNLPCGESLARSLILGQKFFKGLRKGQASKICWIPDVFGYSACLPQVLKLGGVPYFFTSKMTWSQVTKFPYTSFVWRGSDGSEVLTHLCASKSGYNGNASVESVAPAAKEHRQLEVHPEMLLPTGFGDGGGGASEEMLERARRLKNLAGIPKARWGTAEAFFDRLAKLQDKLPSYQGELYLEYHRGTYTTQGLFKFWHRALERALQAREALRATAGGMSLPEQTWLRLCFSQFHDGLPGSSINIVYAQLGVELERLAKDELKAASAELKGPGSGVSVFNPLGFERELVVEVPSKKKASLVLLRLKGLESRLLDSKLEASAHPIDASTRHLDNGRLRADFDAQGNLKNLSVDGKALGLAAPCGLFTYVDQPHGFDAWEVDHQLLTLGNKATGPLKLKVIREGALRARLQGVGRLGEKSRIRVDYVLEAGSPWLKIEIDIDWRERHRLLKFHTPTGYAGKMARFGGPFGSIQRPQQSGTEREEAMWEVPGSRWAAVCEDSGEGLALVTEAKYGFSCRNGNLGLTLLRSSTDPDEQADQGRHLIRFALSTHRDKTEGCDLSTAAAAESLYSPLIFSKGQLGLSAPFELKETGSLTPSWVLPSQKKGLILRLHETAGGSGKALLTLSAKYRSASLVDFLEKPLGRLKHLGNGSFELPYLPYQIISVLIR